MKVMKNYKLIASQHAIRIETLEKENKRLRKLNELPNETNIERRCAMILEVLRFMLEYMKPDYSKANLPELLQLLDQVKAMTEGKFDWDKGLVIRYHMPKHFQTFRDCPRF